MEYIFAFLRNLVLVLASECLVVGLWTRSKKGILTGLFCNIITYPIFHLILFFCGMYAYYQNYVYILVFLECVTILIEMYIYHAKLKTSWPIAFMISATANMASYILLGFLNAGFLV